LRIVPPTSTSWNADHRNDIAQRHVDDVDRFVLSLGDCDDLVAGLECVRLVRCTARDDSLDDRVAVLRREGDADPVEREAHLDLEVLDRFGWVVGRVRVEGAGKGVQEICVGIAGLEFQGALGHELRAMDQLLLRLVELHVAAQIVGHLEVDEAFEQAQAIDIILGMAALVGVEDQTYVRIERVVLARYVGGHLVFHALVAPVEIALDIVEEFALAVLDREEHALQLTAQLLDLGAEEEGLRGIDAIDIGVDRSLAEFAVETAKTDMTLEQALDQIPAPGAGQLRRTERHRPRGCEKAREDRETDDGREAGRNASALHPDRDLGF